MANFTPPKEASWVRGQLLAGMLTVEAPDGSARSVVLTVDPVKGALALRHACGCVVTIDLVRLATMQAAEMAAHETLEARDGAQVH